MYFSEHIFTKYIFSKNSALAWFSVNSAGTSVQSATQTLTIVDNETEIGGVKFNAVKGTPTVPTALELSDNDGVTKLKVGEDTVVKPGVTFTDTYAIVPISVTVTNVEGGATFAEKIASLAGDSVVIDVTGAFATHTNANAAIKYKVSAAPQQATGKWATESVTGIKPYEITGSELANATIIAEFNIYVGIDGTNQYATEDIAEENLTITVTPRYVAA